MQKYNGRFQIDLTDDVAYLDTLQNLPFMDVVIGSAHCEEFWPIAFCRNDILTITPCKETEDGNFIQEDLIELAAYVKRCNGDVDL